MRHFVCLVYNSQAPDTPGLFLFHLIHYAFPMEGILLFYKPVDWTNKHILGFLKRTLNVPKLGHAGTLDPFAEGLMVVAIGRTFTRGLHTLLTASTKEYIATIELGKVSDTFDRMGTIIDTGAAKRPSVEAIHAMIDNHLLGERTQIPPVYSAKKFSGKRLRDIATKEGAHELASSRAKMVTLYNYEIVSYAYPLLVVRLSVSSGYYIRTFGNDLGSLLGTGAYLTNLKRTRINEYTVEDALAPDDLKGTVEARGTLIGAVQGVGYRYFIFELARQHNLAGITQNTPDGSVSFVIQGAIADISRFLKAVHHGPIGSRIDDYSFIITKPHKVFSEFTVL